MKNLSKSVAGVVLAGLLSLALITDADAQRGRGGFYGGIHVGGGYGYHGAYRYHGGYGYRNGYVWGGYAPAVRFGVNFGYPHVGVRINVLPYGYYPFYYGPDLYYYYGGTFYRPNDGGGYQVTVPPVGAEVPSIPKNASAITINGEQFFEAYGVYYKAIVEDNGKTAYVVAGKDGVLNTDGDNGSMGDSNNSNVDPNQDNASAPHPGDVVTQLPDGCRKITLNGKKYYISPDNVYYEEFTDANNNISYRVVSISGDEDQK